MYEIRRDTEKNRLYITIGNRIDRATYKTMQQEIDAAVADLSPGFTCLTDMREYHRITENEEIYIAMVQTRLKEAGLSRAVRVARRRALHEHVQFDTGSQEAGYPSDVVRTVEEGEAFLDFPEKNRHL